MQRNTPNKCFHQTFLQVKAEGSSTQLNSIHSLIRSLFLLKASFSPSNSPSYIVTTSTVFGHQTSEVTKLFHSFQTLSIANNTATRKIALCQRFHRDYVVHSACLLLLFVDLSCAYRYFVSTWWYVLEAAGTLCRIIYRAAILVRRTLLPPLFCRPLPLPLQVLVSWRSPATGVWESISNTWAAIDSTRVAVI